MNAAASMLHRADIPMRRPRDQLLLIVAEERQAAASKHDNLSVG